MEIGMEVRLGPGHIVLDGDPAPLFKEGAEPPNFRPIFTARRSYASAVLGVVILSVSPSVCLSVRLSHACFVTNPKNLPAIFLYHAKGQSF